MNLVFSALCAKAAGAANVAAEAARNERAVEFHGVTFGSASFLAGTVNRKMAPPAVQICLGP